METRDIRVIHPTGQGRRQREVVGIRTPALLKTAGDDPQEIWIVTSKLVFLKRSIFYIFQHFQNEVDDSEEKLNLGGRWVWVPMNPTPNQNFVATPLSQAKHRGPTYLCPPPPQSMRIPWTTLGPKRG